MADTPTPAEEYAYDWPDEPAGVSERRVLFAAVLYVAAYTFLWQTLDDGFSKLETRLGALPAPAETFDAQLKSEMRAREARFERLRRALFGAGADGAEAGR